MRSIFDVSVMMCNMQVKEYTKWIGLYTELIRLEINFGYKCSK